jgi:hypothetical protein
MALIPSKFNGYSRDGIRKYGVISFGGGSSSTTVEMTPEQKELLRLQTDSLKNVFMPNYESAVKKAGDVYQNLSPYMYEASKNAFDTYGDVGEEALNTARESYGQGREQLSKLFDPDYEKNQINAALQAGREAIREQMGGQNAMYGASGGLGSSRMALADKNLQQLGEQRQATAAAGAQSLVQQNRMAAANSMLGVGKDLANLGVAATGKRIDAASAPMDLLAKYAGVVFGTPQASTAPNFTGTQGSSTSGFGGSFGIGSDINIKTNIQKIGVLDNGLNLYKYEYKAPYKDTWGHGEQIGVMAQEVEKIIPEAVGTHPDGYKTVNYAMVM